MEATFLKLLTSFTEKTNKNIFQILKTNKKLFSQKSAVVAPFRVLRGKRAPMLQAQPLFQAQDIVKLVPGDNRNAILNKISLRCLIGSKVAILGANGSGKSTLLKILSKQDDDFNGELEYLDKNIRIGYLSQTPSLSGNLTVKETIKNYLKFQFKILNDYRNLTEKLSSDFNGTQRENEREDIIEQIDVLERKISLNDCWGIEDAIKSTMEALKCPPENALIQNLSGGEKRRVAFCGVLLSRPEVLMLDEPTNHFDSEGIQWMETYLQNFNGTLFTVSHDRHFIDKVSNWVLEISGGKIDVFAGNYSAWSARKVLKDSAEKKKKTAQLKHINKALKKLIEAKKLSKSKEKKKALLEASKREIEEEGDEGEKIKGIVMPEGPKLGSEVVSIEDAAVSFEGRKVFDKVSVRFTKKSIVGIVGPNGSGKSTLFRTILGEVKTDEGSVKIGKTVKIGYFAQTREELDPELTVWQAICGKEKFVQITPEKRMFSRRYVAQFLFKDADQEKLVGSLSGGEKNRVSLAGLLKKGCNVLLLDEPSNDLDLVTLTALEKSLVKFEGLVLCISHDRYFLRNICDSILEFDGKGAVRHFNCSYDHYTKIRHLSK